MSKYVRSYTNDGRDVLTEARNRIRQCYEQFDHVVVSYSGGKDSQVCLQLCRDVGIDEGFTDKVKVVFRDEELIHQSVIDYVAETRQADWIDLEWWAVPMASHKLMLGIVQDYVQWDPKRDPAAGGVGWIRDKPDFALDQHRLQDRYKAYLEAINDTDTDPETFQLSQFDASEVSAMGHKGTYCQIVGVRAAESPMRYTQIMAAGGKEEECWLYGPMLNRVYTAKPVFDWHENDVFKYLHDEFELGHTPASHPYCSVYDAQLWARREFRVGTALNAAAAKMIDKLRASDPDLYGRVMDIFPEMVVQERYSKDVQTDADKLRESGMLDGTTYDDVNEWIHENLDGSWRKEALRIFSHCSKRPDEYPPDYLLEQMANGGYQQKMIRRHPDSKGRTRAWVNNRYVQVDDEGVPIK